MANVIARFQVPWISAFYSGHGFFFIDCCCLVHLFHGMGGVLFHK